MLAAALGGCAGRSAVQGPVRAAPSSKLPHQVDANGRIVPVSPSERGTAEGAIPLRANANGTWDWLFRSKTQQGDLRIEQEEWHLQQEGTRVFGYYHRQVVTLSADQRPFRCNGMLAFHNNTRVRVLGEIRDGVVTLREVGVDAEKNSCDDGARNLTSYVGRLDGDSLSLEFAPGSGQHLIRRPANSPILPLNPDGDRLIHEEDLAQVKIEGVWDWQFRAADPEGDLHIENEEWHLTEKNAEVAGYYERTLERRRTVGVFACNGTPVIRSKTRYVVKGQRFGNKLSLSEVDYQAQVGPCENGARRLDRYQGTLLPEGQMLLSWGGGQQTLHKRKD